MGIQKVTICHKRKDCIGCGSCILLAPNQRYMDDEDGKALLINSEQKGDFFVSQIDIDDVDANIQASTACPMDIIQIPSKTKT